MVYRILLTLGMLIIWAAGLCYLVFGFSGNAMERLLDEWFPAIILVALATSLGYVFHALRSPVVPQSKRQLWAALLFVASIPAQPVYWWLYVVRGEHVSPE